MEKKSLKQEPLIAVVVPVYNVAPYIEKCLESLLAQTYQNWVAYVIDDGTEDESAQIAEAFAAMDHRFRVFHKDNGGLASARNFALDCIEKSEEQFEAITFLDSDDWLDPEAYSELVRAFLSESADIVFCGFKWAFPDRVDEWKFVRHSGEITRTGFFQAVFSFGDWRGKNGSWGVVWNKLYRYEVVRGHRFLEDREYNEDELFCIQIGLKSSAFCFVDKSLVYYRQRPGSLIRSADFDFKLNRSRMKILEILEEISIPEKEAIVECVKQIMLYTFIDMYCAKTVLSNRDYLIADAAKAVLSIAQKFLRDKKIPGEQYEYVQGLSQVNKYETLVSVLVPVYNVERYLRQCLDSIIGQTLKDIEIICVNDGSTDCSLQILQDYSEKDSRVRIVSKEKNEGTHLARKAAVLQAKGKYIVFIDSDDMLTNPSSLWTMVAEAEHEQVDILQFSVELLSPDGKRMRAGGWHQVYQQRLSNPEEIISECLAGKYSWCLWNKIYRAEGVIKAYREAKDIRLITAEDCYAYFLIAYHANTFAGCVTPPLYTYRQESGVTRRIGVRLSQYEMFCQETFIVGYLRSFLKNQSLSETQKRHYEKVLQKLNQRFLEHCIWRGQDLAENDRDEAIKLLQGYFTPEFVISSCLSKLSDRDAEIASCLSKLSDRDAEIASCLSKLSDRDAEIASYREQNQKLKQKAERYDKIANTVRPFAPEGSRRRRLARFVLKKLYRYLRPKEKG